MQHEITITTPFDQQAAESLRVGQHVLITGRLLTARDAAHKRLCQLLDAGKPLPVDLQDQIIYFVGPTPARPGRPIGSAGPTTSSRMDPYSVKLMDVGLRGTIGKGYRGDAVRSALQRYGAVHFSAVGGAAALLARTIISAKIIAYEDLGPEAIYELVVEDFPAVVAYDTRGNTIYAPPAEFA